MKTPVLALIVLIFCATPAYADTLAIVSGDNQVVKRSGDDIPGGRAIFKSLSVVLKDGAGRPIPQRHVSFSCQTTVKNMACQIDRINPRAPVGILTDSNGVATLKEMMGSSIFVYYASGKFTVRAEASGGPAATFSLEAQDALPPPPPPPPIETAVMAAVSGDGQKAARKPTAGGYDTAEFAPLSVKLMDGGKPLAGARVTWACVAPMSCDYDPAGFKPTVTTTDGNGVSVLNKLGGKSVVAYHGDGAITMTATYGKSSVAFRLDVIPLQADAASTMNVLTLGIGNNQVVNRDGDGKAKFAPLSVILKDSAGKPISGGRVNFACQTTVKNMTCQMDRIDPRSGAAFDTDANGVATLKEMLGSSLFVYHASGRFTVQATANNAKPISFSLEARDTPPPPPPIDKTVMTAVSGDGQKAALVRTPNGTDAVDFAPLAVKVMDGDKPLQGVRVLWVCFHPGAMACKFDPSNASPIYTVTDVNGVTVLNHLEGKSVRASNAAGAIKMTAHHGQKQVSFNLTVVPAVAPAIVKPPALSIPAVPAEPSNLTAPQKQAWQKLVQQHNAQVQRVNALNAQITANWENPARMRELERQQEALKSETNILTAKFNALIAASR